MAAPALASDGIRVESRFGVQDRLAVLAHSRGPLRRALAAIAGRLVATRAWGRLGFARPRDYAAERLGLSARSLQDLAHVDAALGRLPALEAALVSGVLTWTKVRLVARIATPEDEARWIAYARRITARALAREVRAVDLGSLEAGAAETETDEDGAPEEVRIGTIIPCTPEVNGRWHSARQLARRMAGEPLPAWGCAETVAAEVLSALGELEDEPTNGAPTAEPAARATPSGAEPEREGPRAALEPLSPPRPATSPEPPAEVRKLLEGLDDADAFELDRRLRRGVALEQEIEARMGPLLRDVADRRLFYAAGFTSLEAFARERLGISPRRARALLRLERMAARIPELRGRYRDGRFSWVQAQALVPVLLGLVEVGAETADHINAWLDWAGSVTVRRLEEDVDRALVLLPADPEAFARSGGLPDEARPEGRQAGAQHKDGGVDDELENEGSKYWTKLEGCRVCFSAPVDVARLFRAVLCTMRRRMERATGRLPSEGETFGAMLAHAQEAWGQSAGRPDRSLLVFERDAFRCTAPGCSSMRNLHAHHIRFRSAGGSDDLANQTTLCAWHHQRGVHAGIVRVLGRAPDGLRFELGVRRDGPPLLRFASGDRHVA